MASYCSFKKNATWRLKHLGKSGGGFEPRKWLLILMLRFFFFRIHQGTKGDIQLPRVTGDTFQDQRPAVERPGKSRLFLGRESRRSRCFVCIHGKFPPLTWEMLNIPACGRQTLYPIMIYWILLGFRWSMMKLLNIFKRRRLKESNKSNKCWDLLGYSWVRLYQTV